MNFLITISNQGCMIFNASVPTNAAGTNLTTVEKTFYRTNRMGPVGHRYQKFSLPKGYKATTNRASRHGSLPLE